MKNTILVLFASIATLSFGLDSFAADSVSVIINGQNYTCSQGGGGGNGDCTVVRKGETDKYGTLCSNANYSSYCAAYYQFGALIEQVASYNAEEGANWCRRKISGN